MTRPKLYTPSDPRLILGYRRNGQPIFPIAGGSEPITEPPPGSTITVPVLPTPVPVPSPPPNGQTFTADDIEKARREEKDKLYGKIKSMDEQLSGFAKERDERIAAEAKARKAAEDDAEAERLKNLSFEQKLTETTATWEQRMSDMQAQLAQRDALLLREREFQMLQEYRTKRIGEETENIMPELHQWVSGNSVEEIEAAISRATETTASILSQVSQAQQAQQTAYSQARQAARGTGVTAPPVGPPENQSGQETFTAEQLSQMDMAEYAKNRGRLLAAASDQMRRR